ncbi:hypothetical protein [Bordetella flabilis]|uniref:Acetoacetate decarboxylase n=1 Tax=Bordetella flabilis TaxID=463014 RepID=A0A193G9S4_9BORD|nr:hypothetical protein [Bordetella flabilis]ANN76226.1 hypothetical protein BAU07_03035 [Bordetella flabilis]
MDASDANNADRADRRDDSGGPEGSGATGRITNARALPAYPGAPWHLHGDACISAWLIDTALISLPVPGTRYMRIGRRCFFFLVWARYLPGGTLSYDELAAGVLLRHPGMLPPAATLHQVWVSEPAAAEGGLDLWRVPKRLGHFDMDGDVGAGGFAGRLAAPGGLVAALRFTRRLSIPVALPARGLIVQAGEGGPLPTPCRAQGKLVLGHADWDFDANGPLSFLRGKRPFVSARLTSMRLSFGA